jgi:hypothetical protein
MNEMARLRDAIAERMEAGESLEEVEKVIEASELDEDEQSAVWLFAWSYLPGTAGRQKTAAASAALAETYDGSSTRQHNLARQLADVMGAVREHEGQTNARRRNRGEDEQLYRRARQALAS